MSTAYPMSSTERVLTAISFKEADRVPYFLLLTTHGARELGMSIRDYFTDPEAVAEGQVRMWRRYRHDCLYGFSYAAVEPEAWGAQVAYVEDGPPNVGSLVISKPQDIDRLPVPDVNSSPALRRVLSSIERMKSRVADAVPIIGVVMAPFSLPVMQMGFEQYFELIYNDRARFDRLMEVNHEFCVQWANAQLQAGATAICYFDPVASTDMVPSGLYRECAYPVACRTIGRIQGPTATHFASGRSLDLFELVAETKTALVGLSTLEEIAEAKRRGAGRLAVFGNLDGIPMRRWSRTEIEHQVRACIRSGAPGGGFILADNHGEIHHSVPESVLDGIADAVHTWGGYPIGSSV